MIFGKFFDVLMWVIVAAIIVTVLLRAGGTTVNLAKIFTVGWLKQTAIISGAPVNAVSV